MDKYLCNALLSLPGGLGLAEEISRGSFQRSEAEHHQDIHKGAETCLQLSEARKGNHKRYWWNRINQEKKRTPPRTT